MHTVVCSAVTLTLPSLLPLSRFCEEVFHGPLSVQGQWITHLQKHILSLGYKGKASPPAAPVAAQVAAPVAPPVAAPVAAPALVHPVAV